MVKSALLDTKFTDDDNEESECDDDYDESDELLTSATDNDKSKKSNAEGKRKLI